ncbi:MAG: hypothetical protein H0U12_00875, partial [Thermoleophilaceae bacterium]|nr:hypothetical protein [Thermoleophilaceae bacterium]
HAVQAARKGAGLAVEDRIELALAGDDELLDAVRAHERYVTAETLAVDLAYYGSGPGGGTGHTAQIEGRDIRIDLARFGS